MSRFRPDGGDDWVRSGSAGMDDEVTLRQRVTAIERNFKLLEDLVRKNEDDVADQREMIQKSLAPLQKGRRDLEQGLDEIAELSTEVKDGLGRLAQDDDRVEQAIAGYVH